jgi:MIF4G domain
VLGWLLTVLSVARFIGELFKQKMLTENIMFECVHTLLRKPQDDNIECLCKLFTTIGKDLDTEKNKVFFFAEILSVCFMLTADQASVS